MPLTIEPAHDYDAPEILALIETYFSYVNMYFEALIRRMSYPWFYYEKSMEGDVLTGFAEWEIIDKRKKTVRLNGMAVKPAYRGKGHAKALLESGEAWARKKGMVMLTLLVAEPNVTAQDLYERNGFVKVGTNPQKINGEVAQIWEKKLA